MPNYILIKVFTLAILSFIFALAITPLLTHFLYKYKLGKQIRNAPETPLFTKMHASKAGTPTMGGILIWGTALVLCTLFWLLDRVLDIQFFHQFNFLTRKDTLLPLGALLGAAGVGLLDDYLDIRRMGYNGRGLRFRVKVILYTAVAVVGAWWFYSKLGFSQITVPYVGSWDIGLWYIPFFIFVVISTSFAVNQTDGLDGLSGGTLLASFFSFGLIAFSEGRGNLAGFIAVICGGLLAFLWFNIFPARFFMGDTGSMGLGVLLAIIAFLTNSVFILPIVGIIFVMEALSTVLQLTWRKLFKKKLFLSAPFHHHFEALGWPETKVTMRFWVVSAVFSFIGLVVYFTGIAR